MKSVPQEKGKNSSRYAAFLRGVNVGGHAPIKMAALKMVFESRGFRGVRTVLASGNVIFEGGAKDAESLARKIGTGLKKAFGMDIGVMVRSLDDLARLRKTQPFAGITVTPAIRFYVTFLSAKAKRPAITIPYATPRQELRILGATATEVFCVVDLAKGKGTPEAMAILEREFGSDLTTRNWNTVLKVLQ